MAEIELRRIAVQLLLANVLVPAFNAALEDPGIALKREV